MVVGIHQFVLVGFFGFLLVRIFHWSCEHVEGVGIVILTVRPVADLIYLYVKLGALFNFSFYNLVHRCWGGSTFSYWFCDDRVNFSLWIGHFKDLFPILPGSYFSYGFSITKFLAPSELLIFKCLSVGWSTLLIYIYILNDLLLLFMFIMIYYYYYKSSHVMTINMLSRNSGRSRHLDCRVNSGRSRDLDYRVKTRAIVASKH